MVNIIEELQKKFKVANIPGRGRCIVISADKFQAEWDQLILEAGCDAHADDEVVYVHIDSYKPQPDSPPGYHSARGQTWTEQENALLIELWNAKDRKTEEIAKEFPNRSKHSVVCRLGRLKKTGKIQPRWHQKRTKTKQNERSTEVVSTPETDETSAPSELSGQNAPSDAPKPEQPQLEFILTQLFEMLHALSCRQLMQELQLRELRGDLVIPRKLWLLYWKALDIKTDRMLGAPREYMRRFQEAATEFLAGYM